MKAQEYLKLIASISSLTSLLLLLTNCGPGFVVDNQSMLASLEVSESEVLLQGKTLYSSNCASCHGSLETSRIAGKTAQQIKQSIQSQPLMSSFSRLTDTEICSLSVALGSNTFASCMQWVKPPTAAGPSIPYVCTDENDAGQQKIRRLSRTEYRTTLTDLLGPHLLSSDLQMISDLLLEDRVERAQLFESYGQDVSNLQVVGYSQIAETIAKRLAQSVPWKTTAMSASCASAANLTVECLNRLLDNFGLRVYRRPLAADERATYVTYAQAQSQSPETLQVIMQALLQSPRFVYRVEQLQNLVPGKTDVYRIDAYELASRLSYTLWGTMPSAELFAAAASGQLTNQATYPTWVAKMLADSKARAHFRQFTGRLLETSSLHPSTHPAWFLNGMNGASLAKDLERDMSQFIDHVVWTKKGSYRQLMTSTEGVISSSNAQMIYQSPASETGTPDQPRIVDLGPKRKGVMTRAAFSYNSDPSISLVHRGIIIRMNLLCNDIPKPNPADFEQGELQAMPPSVTSSSRQIIEHRTGSARCTSCHSLINPSAFATLNYDALGRYRETEPIFDFSGGVIAKHPIDASAAPNIDSPNEAVTNDLSDLSEAIANSVAGPKCMSQKFFEFANGRRPSVEDSCQMKRTFESMKSNSIEQTLREFVSQPGFQLKRR